MNSFQFCFDLVYKRKVKGGEELDLQEVGRNSLHDKRLLLQHAVVLLEVYWVR